MECHLCYNNDMGDNHDRESKKAMFSCSLEACAENVNMKQQGAACWLSIRASATTEPSAIAGEHVATSSAEAGTHTCALFS